MKTKNKLELSEEARKALNAYRKEWREKNREKQKLYTIRYWEKKAAELAAAEKEE